MTNLHTSRTLARLVLAWFALFVLIGSAAPWMQANAASALCSAAPAGSVPAGAATHDDKTASWHSIECPLCLPLSVPLTPGIATQWTPALSAERPPRLPSTIALLASAAAAPPPARGPPLIV